MNHRADAARPPIVFSHANGFPAGTYRVLFEAWRRAGHAVHAIERIGHDPRFPVTSNWPHLRDQLIAFIDTEVGTRPLLVGHSLGGMVSLLAAARRPDLATGVLLLDSPLISGWVAHGVHLAKATGLMRRLSAARVARMRRTSWPARDAVREHFARKAAFARWDPRVLDDYVSCAFAHQERESTLAFEREIEARIYETLPHHMGRLLARRPLRCAVGFIGGRQSVELRRAGVNATRRLVGERFEWSDGTHLFPMEHPQATAELALRMIGRLLAADRR